MSLANIIILNTNYGTASDQKGYFNIELPTGKYTVEIRMIGYKHLQKKFQIEDGEETGLVFELEPTTIKLDSIEVLGKSDDFINGEEIMNYFPAN